MNRQDLLKLIEAALAAGQPSYARQAAQHYLTDWPGDLSVRFALGRASAALGDAETAAAILESVVAADPENWAAHRWLAKQELAVGHMAEAAKAFAAAYVGDGATAGSTVPAWAAAARAAYQAQRLGKFDLMAQHAKQAVGSGAATPLPALLHTVALWQANKLDAARPLAEQYLTEWPRVVALKLCLAECLLAAGDHAAGIDLLHDAAAHDAAGQVVARYWGAHHPYSALWPAPAAAALPGPMPGELIDLLGINRLTAQPTAAGPKSLGQSASKQPHAETLEDIHQQLEQVAGRLPSRETLKYRLRRIKQASDSAAKTASPLGHAYYVALTSKTRLLQAYGPEGFAGVESAIIDLLAGVNRRKMKTALLYVDDPSSLSSFGLRPANPSNAWEVKSLVGKLAARLTAMDSAIGALLIVGSAEIIPFHHLPNPTDDLDPDIPSDNPYATTDDNYFVPEWPVGRIPSPAGNDVSPLVRAIRQAAGAAHTARPAAGAAWLARLRAWLRRRWMQGVSQQSFGYTANVWREASASVFNLIGDPRDLLTSPPLDADALPVEGLAPSRLSYFNLHGIEDGPEWYGQRSFEDPGTLPEYPVALRPGDVSNSGRSPVIVFSEACYGANIQGKQVEDALCLKFLDSGTRVMVGSTKIAYGSVTTPLIGADLLGRCFWQNMTLGLPAGEALRRAKLQMAQEMHRRQGFLDGEDQKTLISFVLYGDPLAVAPPSPIAAKAAALLAAKPMPLNRQAGAPSIACDKHMQAGSATTPSAEMTPEALGQIKSMVERYLPGMRGAEISLGHSHVGCLGLDHACPSAQLSKGRRTATPKAVGAGNTVVTLSKTIRSSTHLHPHYARVTLDSKGAVVKLAVSR